MVLDQTVYFENPEIPEWLETAIRVSFQQKNKENIKGYQLLLMEVIQNG
jgi:hypothetical protein